MCIYNFVSTFARILTTTVFMMTHSIYKNESDKLEGYFASIKDEYAVAVFSRQQL